MIWLGIAGFIASAVMTFTKYSGLDQGGLPAAAIVLILLGMCFYFPTLLREEADKTSISTMRVCVLTVITVFALVYVKMGWTAGSFDDFKLDPNWVWIIGLALGAKAGQRMAEGTTTDESEEGEKSLSADEIRQMMAKDSSFGGELLTALDSQIKEGSLDKSLRDKLREMSKGV